MRLLTELKVRRCTSIFFVAPKRLRPVLILIEKCLGNREIVVAVNLTKPAERILRGNIRVMLEKYTLRYPEVDEVTLVVAGR